MLDAHCHVDLYPDPTQVALRAEQADAFVIAVTNLPSAFERAYPHVRQFRKIRLGLGLHPLLAVSHRSERKRFRELCSSTSYIGEVGLDFSREGFSTRDIQRESFRFVLETLGDTPRFVSIHSRRAEKEVLEMLIEAGRSPVVFHWYSGPINVLEKAVAHGHFFSVNPAMIRTERGRALVARISQQRVLTETDGPFVEVDGNAAEPRHVALVESALAEIWQVRLADVKRQLAENFKTVMQPLNAAKLTRASR